MINSIQQTKTPTWRPKTSKNSASPPPSAITPELVEAAKKEGKVVYYTSIDLPIAEKIAKSFEAKYPGVAVRVERTGHGQIHLDRVHVDDVGAYLCGPGVEKQSLLHRRQG